MEPMSKMEEMNVWYGFIAALPEESYLKPLLTGLDRHLNGCMANDIVENVAEVLEDKKRNLRLMEVQLEDAKVRINGLVRELQNMEAAKFRFAALADRNKVELDETKVRLVGVSQAADEYAERLNAANEQIVALKAKKFDEFVKALNDRLVDGLVKGSDPRD